MNNKLEVAKKVVQYTSSIGASAIATVFVRSYRPIHRNPLINATTYMGGMAITGIVANAAYNHMGQQFDELVEVFTGVKNDNEEK